MSALLDDAPVYVLPERLRSRPALRLVASQDVVGPPRSVGSLPAQRPLQLTRRGVLVLSAAVAVVAAALVALAWLSAPSSAGAPPSSAVAGNTVAVAPGDSLWSIAERVAPNRDPRAEVALLQRLNQLGTDDTALVPGQVLRIH